MGGPRPGCDPRTAVCCWQAGIEPEDWRHGDRFRNLLCWRDYQFTSAEITAWRQPAGLTPQFSDALWSRNVTVWRHLGHSPQSLETHWRQGWRNPHDINQYSSPGESDDAWADERHKSPWAHNLSPTPAVAAQWRTSVAPDDLHDAAEVTAYGGLLSTLGVPAEWVAALLAGIPEQLSEPANVDVLGLMAQWRALLDWHTQYPDPSNLDGLFHELRSRWWWCSTSNTAAWVHHGFDSEAARKWSLTLSPAGAAVVVPFAVDEQDREVILGAGGIRIEDAHIMGARLRLRNQGE